MIRSHRQDVPSQKIVEKSAVIKVKKCKLFSSSLLLYLLTGISLLAMNLVETLIYRAKSQYSTIEVVDKENLRYLYFIDKHGDKLVESIINKNDLTQSAMRYSAFMLSSFLIEGNQNKTLLIGLGGGSLFHLLQRCRRTKNIDAIEIDSEVIHIARKFFYIKENSHQKLIEADGFSFIHKSPENYYDAIYLDAYLKPNKESDAAGYPLNQKTLDYLKSVKSKLTSNGVLVINLNSTPRLVPDLKLIKHAFGELYIFEEPVYGNVIAVAPNKSRGLSKRQLVSRAKLLDSKNTCSFSFEKQAHQLKSIKDF